MPRRARNDMYSNFFHVMIQGLNKEYIFQYEREIKIYLKYVKEKLKDRKLQMIAYCIMNNHAHFLIHTDNVMEISKLMSQVNTKYAIFYNASHNRCGFVFRNRYKSEEILTRSHLISCINYIHNNPVKANMCVDRSQYKYSSYNEYKNKGYLLNIDDVKNILQKYNIIIDDIFNEKYDAYKFIECIESKSKEEKKSDMEKIIKQFLKKKSIENIDEIRKNQQYLKELIILLYIEDTFTQKEIAEILEINRLRIHRILHEL